MVDELVRKKKIWVFYDKCRNIWCIFIYFIVRYFYYFGEVLVGICMFLNYFELFL